MQCDRCDTFGARKLMTIKFVYRLMEKWLVSTGVFIR